MRLQKNIFIFLMTTLVLLSYTANAQMSDQHGDIVVTISNIESSRDDVRVALTNSAKQFSSESEKPEFGGTVRPSSDKAEYTFRNVPFGIYAVKAFEDSNENGILDKGAFGIPKEKYGFSNVPAGKKGMPPFERASFPHNSAITAVEVDLK